MTLLVVALAGAWLGGSAAHERGYAASSGAPAPALLVWRLEGGHVTGSTASDRPLPAGSLLKPFVAKAWARGHAGHRTPRTRCDAASGCWIHAGHGALGLSRAIALSCNAYFRALAAATPESTLVVVLREEGFLVPDPLSAEEAVGLDRDAAVAVRPDALLRAYVRLTREPWAEGEPARRELLAGLRDNATSGTARGLGRYGFWAKTGTVPALDGRPLATSGLTIAVDDAGRAVLGLLPHGTGREAARALSTSVAAGRPNAAASGGEATEDVRLKASSAPVPGRVSVALFGGLKPKVVVARNAGDHPLSTSRGYVGAGAATSLRPGDWLSEGRWMLSVPSSRFRREVVSRVSCNEGAEGNVRLRADMAKPEYVRGVLNAELPGEGGARGRALAAAVLRFLAVGPRHGATDVCDSTHCAWFIGRGPGISWPTPQAPVLFTRLEREGREAAPFDAAAWDEVVRSSQEPGPRQWTSHCGGRSLSAHAVWGNGDRRVWVCDRHPGPSAPWTRLWDDAAVEAAFGGHVRSLAVKETEGVWTLAVETAAGTEALSYDEAHRRLAPELGWAALPSPADSVVRAARAWRAEGVGLGHRVGLCLAGC